MINGCDFKNCRLSEFNFTGVNSRKENGDPGLVHTGYLPRTPSPRPSGARAGERGAKLRNV